MTLLSGISPPSSPSPSSEMPLSSLDVLSVFPLAVIIGKLSNDPFPSSSPVNGLDRVGSDPLRSLLRLRMLCRSEMTCPACGAAITTVPGLASGGGVGESDRNNGWMCNSDADAEMCSVKARCGGFGSGCVRVDAGLKLRLRLVWNLPSRGGSKSSGVPGLGLRLVVGLAGIVSRKRPPLTGDADSMTVRRFCESTPDVSHESNASSLALDRSRRLMESKEGARLADRWLRWLRRLWLRDSRRVLEEIDRTVEVIVSVAENPPLEGGGSLESIEWLRDEGSGGGVVWLYGTVLTRFV